MASQGPRYPTTAVNVSTAPENTDAWVNPTNVGADDAAEASITAASYDAPDISQQLRTSGYGFTIPAGATITGIVVEIMRRNSAGAASDHRVQLTNQSNVLVGDNKADTALDWPTAEALKTYGGSADTWAASPDVAMVNDNSFFGVTLSVQADAANTDIQVDFIRMTVHYTVAADTALAGSSAGSSTATGNLTTQITLAGTSAGVATAAGVLTMPLLLAGSSAGSSNAAGVLTTQITLAGAAAGSSSAAGVLTTQVALAGSSSGAATAAGILTTQITLAGSSAGSSSAAGSLTMQVALAGSAAGSSSAAGSLTTQITLAGSTAGSATAAGILTTQVALAGSTAGSATAAGALTDSAAEEPPPPPPAIPGGGGGGARLLPRGKPFRERHVVPEVVAVHLMNDLVDRYGLVHGREVYFAMEREAKGPFAPGNKYDVTQRPTQPVEIRTPPKPVRVRASIPPARRS